MAQVSFTIPDGILARVNNGIAAYHGYKDQIPDPSNPSATIPNPQTKAQFNKEKIKETIKSWVVAAESSAGSNTAKQDAMSNINIQD